MTMKKATNLLFVTTILSFSFLLKASPYTAWDYAALYMQKYDGEFKSNFLQAVCGAPYWKSLLSKKNPSDLGLLIYESLFVVGDFPKALAKNFKGYHQLSVEKKAEMLDDLCPILWNKLYKYESYLVPQVICGDLCMIAESLIEEISTLKQEKDSKLLSTLLYENSQVLRAYYQYRENRNCGTKANFFDVLSWCYRERMHRGMM